MSFIQMESLVDLQQKNAYGKYRRHIALLAVVTGTAILGLVLLSGLFHFKTLSIAPPMSTSISLRPDYPVSTFIYERGAFSWFIGGAVAVVRVAVAFASVGTRCVVVTGGVAVAGSVLAAAGVAFTVVATVQISVTTRQLRLAQQAMITW